MTLTDSKVWLHRMRFYAHHGVMAQEQTVGGWFTVTVAVGCDLSTAMCSDDVGDTLNYARLYELVCREMTIPSRLLEHVAGRIVQAIVEEWPQAASIDLWLDKDNPPMGADCGGAGVELHLGTVPI